MSRTNTPDLEVTMAVQGVRLPDVRDECGCEARP